MKFRKGESVMHWTYGLGKVVRLEHRQILGQKTLYYAVQVNDMTVWVPADETLDRRLRRPSSKGQLRKLRAVLSGRAERLPEDRQERKAMLMEWLKDGRAESLCRVVRSLTAHGRTHSLNDSDQALLKRAQNALLSEWGHALSVTPAQAEAQLRRIIGPISPGV